MIVKRNWQLGEDLAKGPLMVFVAWLVSSTCSRWYFGHWRFFNRFTQHYLIFKLSKVWNGKSAISALWMVSDPNFPSDASCNLFDYCSVEVDAGADGIICWSSEQNYSRRRDAKLFWLLFPKTCKILQVCQGSKLKGVQDSCFQVGVSGFFWEIRGKWINFVVWKRHFHSDTTTWRHCVVPLKPWYQWHGLGGWRSKWDIAGWIISPVFNRKFIFISGPKYHCC